MIRFATSIALLFALPTAAQEAPRVDGQADGEGALVTINELNTDDYPDVRVIATITRNGTAVTGLAARDFRVREDEVDQRPLTVEEQLPPLSVVVTIDTSGSMADAMDATRMAATAFVAGLDPEDAAQIMPFAETVVPATGMTTDRAVVTAAIGALAARGDTALYDALAASVDLLVDARGRRAIVVLSDGVDDNGAGEPLSTAMIDDVLTAAAAVNVPIFTIGLGTEMDEAVLTEIAEATGALYLNAPNAEELGRVYGQIGAQLSGQYSIRYTSSLPADGTERRVDLDAPQGRDSKSYTPDGAAASGSAQAPAAEGCAPLDVLLAGRADLEQAKSWHDSDLISISDLNAARVALIDEVMPLAQEPQAWDCILNTLTEVKVFHDADLISISAQNDFRNALARPYIESCAARTEIEELAACIQRFDEAHDAELISISMREDMRDAVLDPLIEPLRGMGTDAALQEINRYHDAGWISISQRDGLRREMLAAQ